MRLEIRRSRASPGSKVYLHQHGFDVGQVKRKHMSSNDVTRRILTISRKMDQANAIAELMK